MLAVAVGMSTWKDRLRGRSVRIFSDNSVAEYAFRRGSAAAADHAALVHSFWLVAHVLGLRVHIERVPTGMPLVGARASQF